MVCAPDVQFMKTSGLIVCFPYGYLSIGSFALLRHINNYMTRGETHYTCMTFYRVFYYVLTVLLFGQRDKKKFNFIHFWYKY